MAHYEPPLCGICGHTMGFVNSKWVDRKNGARQVVWRCRQCGDDYVEAVPGFDLRSCLSGQWSAVPMPGQLGQVLLALVLDVEGWPVKTTTGAVLQGQGNGKWHVETATGEILDEAPLVHGGPLDRLITGLINQQLKALRSGVMDNDPSGKEIDLAENASEMSFEWEVSGLHEHRLRLWIDGWPVVIEQHLTAIKGEPRPGDPRGRHDWYVITPKGGYLEQAEGLPTGVIGEYVATLCQERLEQLRRWDEMRKRRRRQKP